MKIIKTILHYIIQFTWGLPQNIIGLITFLILKKHYVSKHNYAFVCHVPNKHGSVSLGLFIFVNELNQKLIKHEYGHTLQSLYLGIFWTFIIAIPSLIWACCFKNYRKKYNISYNSFYTESWAEKLGENK